MLWTPHEANDLAWMSSIPQGRRLLDTTWRTIGQGSRTSGSIRTRDEDSSAVPADPLMPMGKGPKGKRKARHKRDRDERRDGSESGKPSGGLASKPGVGLAQQAPTGPTGALTRKPSGKR